MSSLKNKNIILGISGGIAAYKCAELTRRLKDHGANIRVVMTNGAKAFITPLTMQAVSGNPVSDDLLDPAAEAAMGHIELAKWADLVLIAPATANMLAIVANGNANDLLSTLCLATKAPIALCPAMNQQMWASPPTQRNIATIKSDGRFIFGPASGQQACGDVGEGRMLEPNEIIDAIQSLFVPQVLARKKVVITAGPTQEALDPVRYISNHSSGKMGYMIAKAAQQMGATVVLISGPCSLPIPYGVTRVNTNSAEKMLAASLVASENADLFIACAAVADYRPISTAEQKIKKNDETMSVELTRNPDILATVANLANRPFTIGFAAETQDVERYALDKLTRKNLDMIAANNVAIEGQGFSSDKNALTVYWEEGKHELPLNNKEELAKDLVQFIAKHYQSKLAI